jgi:hypothetical protein
MNTPAIKTTAMNTTAVSASDTSLFAIPSGRTLINLAIGGCAGLGFWEFFSAVPTALAAGFALEPPELVKSLFQHQLGITLSTTTAKFLHYMTGIIFYPLAFWVLSKLVPNMSLNARGWIWGIATYFIALGLFATLAGQPFLLHTFPILSFMSLVGHAIYGWLAAIVYDRFQNS